MIVLINGGNRMQAYAKPVEMTGVAKDPDIPSEIS